MSAIRRGFINPFRNRARAIVVVVLLSLVTGFLALMVQATLASRTQIAGLEGRIRNLIELREAGAFGTGGFGGDKPIGEEHFSLDTLQAVRSIPGAQHLARVDEYVYKPDIDALKKNAYAMVIGLNPGAALRAIGEVDYESARIVAGRAFTPDDDNANVAVVGQLYAAQRLGLANPSDLAHGGRELKLNGRTLRVIGVYTTGNDFGDNHVFIPIDVFRAVFNPGQKLSKIFVTVDSVANVERVVAELKRIPEADVVTTPEAVSTARTALGSIAVASAYAAVLFFALGAVLTVFVMILSTRERICEIGTLKAIGASNREVVLQLLTEALTLSVLGAIGATLLAVPLAALLTHALKVSLGLNLAVVSLILAGALSFAALGSLYPVVRGIRLSPIEAMRRTE